MKYLYLHGLGQNPDSWNRTRQTKKLQKNFAII